MAGVVLSIDVGDAWIGLAKSDARGLAIAPLEVVIRKGGKGEKRIFEVVQQYTPSTVVIGVPLGANRQITEQAVKVLQFVRRLMRRGLHQVVLFDEFGSSKEANQYVSSRSRNDAHAAACILRSYFEDEANNNGGILPLSLVDSVQADKT